MPAPGGSRCPQPGAGGARNRGLHIPATGDLAADHRGLQVPVLGEAATGCAPTSPHGRRAPPGILRVENDANAPARVPTHGLGSDVGSILQRLSIVALVR